MTMTPDDLRALADAIVYRDSLAIARVADYLRAQADAQPAPAVPAGWQLVPVEPTPEMLSAVGMMDGYDWNAPGCSPDADHANWYSAMISVAPVAPQAEPKREPLMALLELAEQSDDCQYGTLSTSIVRELVNEALGIGGSDE